MLLWNSVFLWCDQGEGGDREIEETMKWVRPWGAIGCLAGILLGAGGCAEKQTPEQLTVWHWMSDREGVFQELAERYHTLTGVSVRFDLFAPSDAYSQKVKAAAQTDTLPDIFGILGEKRDLASFILSGHVANFNQEMDREEGLWRHSFFEKALAMNEFAPDNSYGVPPGIFGVPIDVNTIQWVYNKELFRKAGLDPNKPPVTWKAWIHIGKKLKSKGIQGLVSGWGEIWLIECLVSNFAWNLMGQEKVLATIQGKVPYTDPDWIRVLKLFQEMSQEGILADGIVTMINKRAEQIFSNGQAALAMNGSWCVNVYYGMNPNLDYGVILPPRISSKYPQVIWGGASSFMVNAKSKRQQQAIAFLKWLTAKDQQVYLSNQTRNLPATRAALTDIPAVLAGFADDMDRVVHPSVLPVAEFPSVTEALTKGIQSIIIGEKTPEQIAQEAQDLKEREMAKKLARTTQ